MVASGYHFVFSVPFNIKAHLMLQKIGHPHPKLLQQYRKFPQSHGLPLIKGEAQAFDGAGKLIEYLIRECQIPKEYRADFGNLNRNEIKEKGNSCEKYG